MLTVVCVVGVFFNQEKVLWVSLFFPIFSIKEMELFVRWSAKVWALWIVIIQLAASKMSHPLRLNAMLLELFNVRVVRIIWMSFFLHSYTLPQWTKKK